MIHQDGRVGIIELNDPERRNPLSNSMISTLLSKIDQLDNDDAIGAIVITGNGKAFSAGGNLQDFSVLSKASAVDLLEEGNLSIRLFNKAKNTKKPLIAAVNGYALGGGFGLAAMCDLVIASEKAKMGTTEIKVGGFPIVILPVLMHVLGEKKTMELALTGKLITANEAKECGLVSEVVEHDQLMNRVIEIANEIASFSPLALKLGKKAFYDIRDMPIEDALQYMASLRVTTFLSEDLQEGASAFVEKRKPEWKGR